MASRKKRVGEIDTTTLLLVLGGGAALLYFMTRPQTPATIVYRAPTTPVNNSGATTAAEIAAGAGLADTLINDLTGN
jgi:hypothetical protein